MSQSAPILEIPAGSSIDWAVGAAPDFLGVESWVQEDGSKTGPTAHILVYPTRARTITKMHRLAMAMGLGTAVAREYQRVPPESTCAELRATGQDAVVLLYTRGDAWLEVAVSLGWGSAAKERGCVVVSVAVDPLPEARPSGPSSGRLPLEYWRLSDGIVVLHA